MKYISRKLSGSVGNIGGKGHLGIEQRQTDRESILFSINIKKLK